METVFKLKASELNGKFIESIKSLFKNEEIEISIKPARDETDFLLGSVANREALLAAISEVKNNKNLISFSCNDFEALSNQLAGE
ncbi:MAG: hypothetical protein NTX61_00145 [Bacteroidetes bacterium]|nr:hypothetical protein [Bacteroidota bacterium]